MKKNYPATKNYGNLGLIFVFILANSIFGACKKSESIDQKPLEEQIITNPLALKAQAWYKENSILPGSINSNDINLKDYKPDWSKFVLSKNLNGSDILTVPLIGNKNRAYLTELGLVIYKDGVSQGMIKEYIDDPSKVSTVMNLYTVTGQFFLKGKYNPERMKLAVGREYLGNKSGSTPAGQITYTLNTKSISASGLYRIKVLSQQEVPTTPPVEPVDPNELNEVVIWGHYKPKFEGLQYLIDFLRGSDGIPVAPSSGGSSGNPPSEPPPSETLVPKISEIDDLELFSLDDIDMDILMDPSLITKYPKLMAVVKQLYFKVSTNPKIMAALVKYTGVNEKTILNNLKISTNGPILVVRPNEQMKVINESGNISYPYGESLPGANKAFIFINEDYVKLFEKGNGANLEGLALLLSTTILHEYVHWTENNFALNPQVPNNKTPELGQLFEKDAFGGSIQYNKNNGKVYYTHNY